MLSSSFHRCVREVFDYHDAAGDVSASAHIHEVEQHIMMILSTLTQLVVRTPADSAEFSREAPESCLDYVAQALELESQSFAVDAENQSLLRYYLMHYYMRDDVSLQHLFILAGT